MLNKTRLIQCLSLVLATLFLIACPRREPTPAGPEVPTPAAGNLEQKKLAERLPADTIAYSLLDIRAVLNLMKRSLLFVDGDLGREMIVQAGQLHEGLQRMVRNRGMKAQLLQHWQDARVHLVVLPQKSLRPAAGAKTPMGRKAQGLWGEDVCVS